MSKNFTRLEVGLYYQAQAGWQTLIVDDKGSSPIHPFRDRLGSEYFPNGEIAIVALEPDLPMEDYNLINCIGKV